MPAVGTLQRAYVIAHVGWAQHVLVRYGPLHQRRAVHGCLATMLPVGYCVAVSAMLPVGNRVAVSVSVAVSVILAVVSVVPVAATVPVSVRRHHEALPREQLGVG